MVILKETPIKMEISIFFNLIEKDINHLTVNELHWFSDIALEQAEKDYKDILFGSCHTEAVIDNKDYPNVLEIKVVLNHKFFTSN